MLSGSQNVLSGNYICYQNEWEPLPKATIVRGRCKRREMIMTRGGFRQKIFSKISQLPTEHST